jgi:hypothetical protein
MGMLHDLSEAGCFVLPFSYSFFFSFCDALLWCYMMVRLEARRALSEVSALANHGGIFVYRFLYDTNDWDVDHLGSAELL